MSRRLDPPALPPGVHHEVEGSVAVDPHRHDYGVSAEQTKSHGRARRRVREAQQNETCQDSPAERSPFHDGEVNRQPGEVWIRG